MDWLWTGSTIKLALKNVWMTPLVVYLTEDNGDGRIDDYDIPDVVFTNFDEVPVSAAMGS